MLPTPSHMSVGSTWRSVEGHHQPTPTDSQLIVFIGCPHVLMLLNPCVALVYPILQVLGPVVGQNALHATDPNLGQSSTPSQSQVIFN
mmetsp:Transcript_72525/g.127871  ORF Transcript_72525/g.127871 Transcript_72525/m.127871 type:complete len:88 (+) Transcript_72525:234-497(+)